MKIVAKALDMDKKGYLKGLLIKAGISGEDITEIKEEGLRGNTINSYKVCAKLRKVMNKVLGTEFKVVLRCDKNFSESTVLKTDDDFTLDGDILVLKSDGNWLSMTCSEWGSINLIKQ
jgi:hypothetical protein